MLDFCEIMQVIKESDFASVGMCESNVPYIVPMCFSYKTRCENVIFTLYSDPTGKKMTYLKQNDRIVLQCDRRKMGKHDSVIAKGTVRICEKPVKAMCGCNMISLIIDVVELTGRRYFEC